VADVINDGNGIAANLKPGQIIVHSQAEYEGHAAKGALPSVKVDIWASPFDGETMADFELRIAGVEKARFETCDQIVRARVQLIRELG
jgi:hypothetical protein